jgi:hypothetical protein
LGDEMAKGQRKPLFLVNGILSRKRPERPQWWCEKISKGCKGRKAPNKGIPMSEAQKRKISQTKLAKRSEPNYKPSTNYEAIHCHLRRNYKKPDHCWFCGKKEKLHWANLTGFYSRDINDYRPLCRKCHFAHDARFKQKLQKIGLEHLKNKGVI